MARPPVRIVGRLAERAAVSDFLDAVPSGPAGLFLQGEAGIGKTTLWNDALARGAERSFRILSCRAAQSETLLSFAGLGDLLEALDASMEVLPGPQRRALGIALLREEAHGPPPDQRTVSVAALSLLRELAREGPVLVAVDDLQWLDRPSSRVLEFAMRRLDAEPVGMLATIRTGDGNGIRRWDSAGFSYRRLDVGPLSPTEVDVLLGDRGGESLPRPILQKLHETVRGNPLYALEVARAIETRGALRSGSFTIPIPDDLRRLIGERVARLPAQTRRVLVVASALAQPTKSLVAEAVGDADRTADALKRAHAAGLVEFEDDRVRFVHPLIGSVVYAQAPPEDLRLLHRRLAAIVNDPEEQALHLASAAEGPDLKVADALRAAAERANARGAPDAAADLAEKALTLTPPDRGGDLIRRRLEAAEYHFAAGDTGRAREHLEGAMAASADGSPRALVLLRLGMLKSYDDDVTGAATTLEEALAAASDDPALAAQIHHALCTVWSTLRETSRVVAHARAALDLAEGLGDRDPAMLAKALTTVAYGEFVLGHGVSRETMERALALEPSVESAPIDELPSATFGLMLMWSDDLQGAMELLGSVHRLAVARGDAGSLATVLHYVSELESRSGDFEAASRHALEGDEAAIQTGQEARRVYSLFTRALADAHLGRADEAREEANEALALAERTHHAPAVRLPAVLGFLELSLGNWAEAHRHLAPLPDRVAETGIVELGFHHFMPDEIEALLALGDLDTAEALLGPFEERATSLDRTWALATSARCRGLLLAARGNLPDAVEALHVALVHHERLPQPFELARTLLVLGTTERRAKQKRAARDALERSLGIFDGLGASLWAAKAREELGRIGGRVAKPWDLTATERKVAELATAGRTNKEIAEALFLSVRTVEGTLSRAYHKLNVRSRTELARKLTDEAGAPPVPTAGHSADR